MSNNQNSASPAIERIPVAGPSITQKEISYVTDAVTNAWYGNANMYHERFEKAFADYIGVAHAIALPSCTSAIHLSLLALGVGPGDEVIVPDITWIASAAPIEYVGATTVFADVDEDTWCLSAVSAEKLISERTKAMIPVDLYGGMPDWDALRAVAERHNIPIIEDAAEAIGSEFMGKRAGSFGETGVFSFHGSKTLTTGEGGMLVTDRDDLYERALFLRDHGRKPGDVAFYNREVAHKYKMSSLQAALGLAQLERIDELIRHKHQIFDWYKQRLSDIDGIKLNAEPAGTSNAYWMVTVVLDESFGLDKAAVIAALAERNIDCRPFFYPLSAIPAYESVANAARAREENKTAYSISSRGLNLPSGLNMTEDKVNYVCDSLLEVLDEARRTA